MAFDSFLEFVQRLDQAGELKRISQPIATELEITELADREMKSPGGGKALLIEKPTVNGAVSPFPLAINTMGSWKRMALSLGANSVDEVAAELGSLMKAKPPTSMREALKLLGQAFELRHARPKIVTSGPCKEVIHKFETPPTRTTAWPASPNILPVNAPASAKDSPSPGGEGGLSTLDPRPSTLDPPHPPHPQMLAPRRRTFHHPPLRRHQRPRHRRAQRRHVSHPDL